MKSPIQARVLVVVIAILSGVVVGQIAGALAVAGGARLAGAFATGGVAFAGTVTLALLIINALDSRE